MEPPKIKKNEVYNYCFKVDWNPAASDQKSVQFPNRITKTKYIVILDWD